MKLKLYVLLLGFIFLSLVANATTVEWNQMQSVDTEVWETGPLWYVWGDSKQGSSCNFEFFITHDYINYIASDKIHPSEYYSIWVAQATKGDIVNYESMQSPGREYFYRWEGGSSPQFSSDYDIPIEWGETVYLAMSTVVKDGDESYLAYGWVELGMNGEDPVVKSSAWDVDGGAMIVGGGAIPEPSAAMLLLLGVAGLALRRRRQHD